MVNAYETVARVVDPELPMVTLDDLGVLRDVRTENGTVVVTLTPTYSGCPALATMRADVLVALRHAGFEDAEVRTCLSPAWSSDWISERGRRALAEHGVAPPRPVDRLEAHGAVTLDLLPARPLDCPLCGSTDTREVSRFGTTACRSLHTCRACGETFDHVKEI